MMIKTRINPVTLEVSYSFARDITEEEQLRAENERLKADLAEAQRWEHFHKNHAKVLASLRSQPNHPNCQEDCAELGIDPCQPRQQVCEHTWVPSGTASVCKNCGAVKPSQQDIPRIAIEKILTEVMDAAVANGADSRSMPDEYVEVAAWLCGIKPSQPESLFNWQNGNPVSLKKPSQQAEPARQYYFKVNGCPAESAHDPNCICWHGEGTGPMQPQLDGSYLVKLTWRTTPPSEDARDAALKLAHEHMRLYLTYYRKGHNVFDTVVAAMQKGGA